MSTGVGILWVRVIRYFCHTDASGSRADFCARYAEAFLALGETVRIISVEHAQPGEPVVDARTGKIVHQNRWKALRSHFLTPVSGDYVNVVASHPFWWSRLYTVGIRNVLVTWESPESARLQIKTVPASAKQAAGVRQSVFEGQVSEVEVMEIPHELPDPTHVATRYDAIVVPTEDLRQKWQQVIDDAVTQIDLGEESDAPPCQVVMVGLDLAERASDLRRVLAIA